MHLLIPKFCLVQRITLPSTLPSLCLLSVMVMMMMCCTHTQVLVEADVAGAARLVLMDFPLELSEITHRLQPTPELQFVFLQGIFDPK